MNGALSGPVEVTLDNGDVREAKPITVNDWAAFCRWLNRQNDRPPNKPVPLPEMLEAAATIDGMRWLAARALNINAPDIGNFIQSIETLGRVTEIIMDAGDAEDKDADPPQEGETEP